MRSKVLLTIILSGIISIVKGQEKMDAIQIAGYQTQIMTKELKLDNNQIKNIEVINLKYAEKIVPIMQSEGSMFSRMGVMRKNNNLKKEELKTVLSAEQMKKYEKEVQPMIRKQLRNQRESQH